VAFQLFAIAFFGVLALQVQEMTTFCVCLHWYFAVFLLIASIGHRTP
jgi:hypothetical protein